MSRIAFRVRVVAAALLGAASVAGCGAGAAGTPPADVAATAVAAPDDASAGLMQHHRYHHHGGVTLFIAMSLDTLGVPPEQRPAVEKIRGDLHARMEAARKAEQDLTASLADGVAAAAIDTAKVDADVAQLTAAAATLHDASADALNQLHGVLTPAERAALADKVRAHWAVWQRANAEDSGPSHPDDGPLATLATELGLSADQVARIRAGFGKAMKTMPRLDPTDVAAGVRAFGDAFRGETFDARTLTTAGGANAQLAGWGAARLAHLVETVSPVLTAEQRALFAQQLREHATHDPSAQANP